MLIAYVCVSRACRRETQFESSRMNGASFRPTCECGSPMKKVYSTPLCTRLSEAEATKRFGEMQRRGK